MVPTPSTRPRETILVTELKRRGFPRAVKTAYPHFVVQTCVLCLLPNSQVQQACQTGNMASKENWTYGKQQSDSGKRE
eukprot:1940018-Amphidinium_carterae.1